MRITRWDGLIDRDQAAELSGVTPDAVTAWAARGYIVTIVSDGEKRRVRQFLPVAKREGRKPLYSPVEVQKAEFATRKRGRRDVRPSFPVAAWPSPGEPMSPALADRVIVFTDPRHANGAGTAPAVITRVWTDRMASVRIFHDGPCSPHCTDRATVLLHASRAEAGAQPRTEGLLPSGGWPVPA